MHTLQDARDTYAGSVAWVPSRDELPLLLNERRLLGCAVEIGVKQGHFSEHILSNWLGRHLISIDPWREDTADAYRDVANVTLAQHEVYLAETRERLARFDARSSIWRMTSTAGAAQIPDASLDFVYIDARHDYESVLEDCTIWFPKVRPGGIFAGHDYLDGELAAGVFGVKSAVDVFFANKGILVHSTHGDGPWLTWMAAIPLPR